MNAPCSLTQTLKIRIVVTGQYPLQLCRAAESTPCCAIRIGDAEFFSGFLQGDWMLIHHPRESVGLVGRPLRGGNLSWEGAFDDDCIDVSYRLHEATVWQMVSSWRDFMRDAAHA